MAKIIDFKSKIQIKKLDKINELKEEYVNALNHIESKDENEIDEWFLIAYDLEIKRAGLERCIKQYLQEWKKECKKNSKKVEIDRLLLKEIEQVIDEYINMGLDKNRIVSVVSTKFSKRLPSNIQVTKFLSNVYDDYYNELMGR